MRTKLCLALTALTLLLSACYPGAAVSYHPFASPTALPTLTNTPIPTLTPFQPFHQGTPTRSPLPPTFTPSHTPPATDTPLPSETPTPDLSALLPENWDPPVVAGNGDVPAPMPLLTDDQTITFLLLGSDVSHSGGFRTDVILIAALRPRSRQVSLLSIPRDLWVYIPGWKMQRINTAYQQGISTRYPGGGPGLMADTIRYNLGIRIDHTALVDFDGFRQIVDTLGGINVPVACTYTDWRLISPELNIHDEDNWHLFTVPAGYVHMDGDYALWYARARKKSSDFDRGRRQEEIVRALFDQILHTDTLTKIPALYSNITETVKTDLSLTALLQLAVLAPQFRSVDIRSYYLRYPTVRPTTTNLGAYVLLMDRSSVHSLVQHTMSERSPQAQTREQIVVEIRNGSRNRDWATLAAKRLTYAGYQVQIGVSERHDHSRSQVIDQTSNPNTQQAQTLLAVLGLNNTALVSQPNASAAPHYVLIIGSDYKPCFDPSGFAP